MTRRKSATLQIALTFATWLALVAPGGAFAGEIAFVWANEPTRSSYVPASRYSYNPYGLTNTVRRLSRGRYHVKLPAVGNRFHGGNVQVSAYGTKHRCKATWWSLSANVDVNLWIRCFDEDGHLADRRFTALYQDGSEGGHDLAYGMIDDPSPPPPGSREPSRHTVHNAGDADATLSDFWYQRLGTGRYRVFISDFASPERGWMAMAYGGDHASHCNIADQAHESAWVHDEGWIERMTAAVHCYDRDGRPADSKFTISMAQGRSPGSSRAIGAYMHMANATAPTFTAHPNESWNSESPLTNFSVREGPGEYDVYLWAMAGRWARSTAVVVAEDRGDTTCSIGHWRNSGSFTLVRVRCHDSFGRDRDSEFHLTFVGNER